MNLHIRISETDLCFAQYEAGQTGAFSLVPYHVRPQASLTVNLREAMEKVPLLQNKFRKVKVHVKGPVTPVPLAEFQEEDVEPTYHYCFSGGTGCRVFYDTVPVSNTVLLFALSEAACRTLEETFGDTVHYTSTLTPLLKDFANRGLGVGTANGRRIFVYVHEDVIDVAVMDDTRLVVLNTYPVRTLADVDYYTFNLAHHLGVDVLSAPVFVAGVPLKRDPVADELKKYAAKVYTVYPPAEFCEGGTQHDSDVPYDLVCALLHK